MHHIRAVKFALVFLTWLGPLGFPIGTAQATQVAACEITHKSDIETAKIQYVSDGLKISGFIMRDRKPSKRLPVLIYNRGGNRTFGAVSHNQLNFLAQFARRGYLVVASQYRGGPESQGADRFGGGDVNDIIALMDMAKKLPFADPENFFMYGHSRGGMMTYLALSRTENVRAAVVAAGVSDLSLIAANRADMRRLIHHLVGPDGPAWRDRSAVNWPERLKTPILLFHARDDKRVSIEHATRIAAKLEGVGKQHKLITYRSGGHSLSGHGGEVRDETLRWFRRFAVESEKTPGERAKNSSRTICGQFGEFSNAPATSLVDIIVSGNITAFRKVISQGIDPNAPVSFSHPRFAGGREIQRPPIVATALFRRPDMAKALLNAGASVNGQSASAICAAIVMDQVAIVEALLKAGLDVANFRRCGRGGRMPPLMLAERLGKSGIAELLRKSMNGG